MSHLILQICSLFLPFPSALENCVSKYALSFIIKINMGKFYRNTNGFCPALAHAFNQMLLRLMHYSLGQIIQRHIIPCVQTGSVFLKPSVTLSHVDSGFISVSRGAVQHFSLLC